KIVIQEGGPGVFTWPKKNGVGVARCFFRQRCDVQPAKHDVRSFFSIMIGNRVRSLRGSDVHLNSDEVGLVIKIELLDVFVLEINPPISWEVSGKSGEAERRKQRGLDRPPERAFRFGQSGQDNFYFHRSVLRCSEFKLLLALLPFPKIKLKLEL